MMTLALLFLTATFWAASCLAESSVWAVKYKDRIVYLGGTLHVLRASDYPLPGEFNVAYADSDAIVFETDIASLREHETQKFMRDRLRYGDGRTLSRVLSPDAYAILEKQSHAMGLSLANFDAFRPIMVLLGLLAIELERLGVVADGVDEHFFRQALTDRKSIGHLETVASQVEILAIMGEGRESSFVTHGIEEVKNTRRMLRDTLSAWRVGNEKRLAAALIEPTKRDYPALFAELIVRRNRAWLPKIQGLFSESRRVFVLVGVAHLVGEAGLLRQLEQGGYKVRQVALGGVEWDG